MADELTRIMSMTLSLGATRKDSVSELSPEYLRRVLVGLVSLRGNCGTRLGKPTRSGPWESISPLLLSGLGENLLRNFPAFGKTLRALAFAGLGKTADYPAVDFQTLNAVERVAAVVGTRWKR